jgi:hypothetical protein
MMRALRSTDEQGRAHRLPGYGAVARADVKDARRRRPEGTLEAWAAARGLDHLGSRNAAGYFAVLPLDEQLQFDVTRGVLPGGRDGCLFRWLRPWPVGMDGEPSRGQFVERVFNPGRGSGHWKRLIPVIGDLLSSDVELAIGVPCTVAAVNVPEAAMLDRLPKDVRPPAPSGGSGRPPLWEARLSYGTLAVVRNGWPADEADLDALARAACELAEALRTRCLAELRATSAAAAGGVPPVGDRERAAAALAQPRFTDPLPEAGWPPSGISMSGAFPPSPWLEALHGAAAELSMTLEEPAAFHRVFPSLPVPGRPFAVLRGTLPGTAVPARIAFHQERPLSDNQGRTALLLEADAGVPETAPWGVRNAAPGLAYGVRDGVVALWTLRSSGRNGDLGDLAGFLTSAFSFAAERGLVAA